MHSYVEWIRENIGAESPRARTPLAVTGFMIVDLRLLIEKLLKIKRIPDQKTKNIS
jgi:hypothetical protein